MDHLYEVIERTLNTSEHLCSAGERYGKVKVIHKLTERKVAAILARPVQRRSNCADGGGLALVTYPGKDGTRGCFVLQTRTLSGKPLRIGLGSASVVTLAEARTKAREMRAIIAAGGNPAQQKRDARRGATP